MLQHQIEEDALRLGVVAHVIIDQMQVGRDDPHDVGVDQIAGAQGLFKDP